MSGPQEFTIAPVRSDDPKKKEEKPNDKPDYEGSSKLLGDSKKKDAEGDEQELVRWAMMTFEVILLNFYLVRRGPTSKGSA